MNKNKTVDLIITPRWVAPIAPHNIVLEHHAIAVDCGKIVALNTTDYIAAQFSAKKYVTLAHHVLMPGLVNAHAHTAMNLFKGLADDLDLMTWLQNHIWPAEKTQINADSVTLGSELAIAEMLRGGITCFNDHYFFPDVTAQIAQAIGIRACLGCVIMSIPTQWATDEITYFKKAETVLKHHFQNNTNNTEYPLISWTLAPHAPYTVSDASLKKTKMLADHYHLPIHMHVHETRTEVTDSLQQYHKRPLQRIMDLGLLSERFIAVHCTNLIPDEIQSLADTQTHVVHCPQSNLKLASGFAPISELIAAGVNVAIGTDSAASNNSLDLFAELKIAALLAKASSGNARNVPAPTALKMATLNGAKALGLEQHIGSLEVGKAADIIAIDFNDCATQPVYHPISHLVYATNRSQVSDVWVAGKRLLQSGVLTTIDSCHVIQRIHEWIMARSQTT